MRCRVLSLPASNALYNTALDQYLLERAALGEFTVAFTRWEPSVLLGNSQSMALDVDLPECQKRGVLVMRRFSGGKAVYLNANHIVLTIVGPREYFLANWKGISAMRRPPCEAAIRALRRFNVPAGFFKPDHVVIPGAKIRPLGSSGQSIKQRACVIGTSIRYDLTDDTLREMLAVLKINGRSLSRFFEPVRESLAWIKQFTNVAPEDIKTSLVEEIVKEYGLEGWYSSELDSSENLRVEELASRLIADGRISDKPSYRSWGICDLYLNGRPNIPEIASFLPYSPPSTAEDSTIV